MVYSEFYSKFRFIYFDSDLKTNKWVRRGYHFCKRSAKQGTGFPLFTSFQACWGHYYLEQAVNNEIIRHVMFIRWLKRSFTHILN